MMEKKPIAALIAVIAVVIVAAALASTMGQTSLSQTGSSAAAFQVTPASLGVGTSGDNRAFDPYGPTGQPLPAGMPRVVLFDPSAQGAQKGFWVENGTYYAVWVLNNTGTKSIDAQPYACLNGVLVNGPRVNMQPGQVQTVRVNFTWTGQLPTTAYVNVREFQGTSNNFWVAYNQNQKVNLIVKPYTGGKVTVGEP
jgi:archaellum component FlaG (FlaF/FlaG flagellin family)